MSESDPAERFARDLREHRTDLADAIAFETNAADTADTLPRRQSLLAAQHLLDRLVVLRFLIDGTFLRLLDENRDTAVDDPTAILEALVAGPDTLDLLGTVCLDGLTAGEHSVVRTGDGRRLTTPSLAEDLFRPITVETTDGRTVSETGDLGVAGFDWDGLVDTLAQYDWQIDESGTDDAADHEETDHDDIDHEDIDHEDIDHDGTATLTPAVLGYLSETVAVPLRTADGEDVIADPGTDEPEPPSDTNSEVGAYYTGDAIADWLARRSLWTALRTQLEDDLDAGDAPPTLDPEDLYRPAGERRPPVEADQRDGFDCLAAECAEDRTVMTHVDGAIRDLSVCDPAAGSGAFLLAVASTLRSWRSTCRPSVSETDLRRQIVGENVYGVDLLADATWVCRRRLALWVLAGDAPSADGRLETPTDGPRCPDLTNSIRRGNSLVGFVEPPAEVDLDTHRTAQKRTLDEHYAATRRDAAGDPLQIADHVEDAAAAWRSLTADVEDSPTLVVEVPDGLSDALVGFLDDRGFRTYTYRARCDAATLDREQVEAVFDRLRDLDGGPEAGPDWTALVERPYTGRDFDAGHLDACHWPLAFPAVFDSAGGFDVVIGNPPYGADVAPEAAPLLDDERTYTCQGTGDTCERFYERALALAGEDGNDADDGNDGVVAFVVTKSLAFYGSWASIRERLLAQTAIRHVLDVGLGFGGVNLETIALVHDCGGDPAASTPSIHRTADGRKTGDNRPVHLGYADQRHMREAGTIVFRPITAAQSDVLDRLTARDRRLGDVASTADTTRQLYVPDAEKARLDPGPDAFIDKNHWVGEFSLADVWHVDLGDYREAVAVDAVPRVMLKVLRGSRLRAWLDPHGELVGTEKLVNVPMADSSPAEIAFVYAALNHPCASYYLQKAIFSETTETARVMDGQYSLQVPIPAVDRQTEAAVAVLAWTLTMATQRQRDGRTDDASTVDSLQAALEALLAGVYLDVECERVQTWADQLVAVGPPVQTVRECFEAYYTARYARADGDPGQDGDRIESLLDETVAVVGRWDTGAVLDDDLMAVVTDAL